MMRRAKVKKQPKPKAGLFQGEEMVCAACHLKAKSNSHSESGWTAVEDSAGQIFYLCPQCFSDWLTDAVRWE